MEFSFVDLLWDDILFIKVLPLLSIKDLFILRGLSRRYKLLIDTYFKNTKRVNLGQFKRSFSADAFKVLSKNCEQLQELVLPNCDWLTDDLVIPLLEKNTNLTKLVLNQCRQLTSVCLQPIIINSKNLRCLCVSQCLWLTVGCVESITLHQHSLEEVDFSACFMIDSLETINNFLIVSHKIRVLNLSKLLSVNDTTLTVLSRSAKRLELLNISGCDKVTNYGISLLIEYCRNLKGLICHGCTQVSTDFLKIERRKDLRIFPTPKATRVILPRVNV